MDKEEQLFRKRIQELASVCYQRDVPVHTDFLNFHEQTIFHSLVQTLPPVSYVMTGGYEMAERKVVCFLPSYEEELVSAPFCFLRLVPVNKKFAEKLSHRDFLGALMSLGIERSKIGDILVNETECYILCMEELAEYVKDSLNSVRHTNFQITICQPEEIHFEPKFETVSGSVASLRLDAVLAAAWSQSRGKMVPYIEGEKVFVNGCLVTSNSYQLKEGDIVSVRGFGKFIYRGVQNQTKKGRLFVVLDRYC